jgi:hypothetical protein
MPTLSATWISTLRPIWRTCARSIATSAAGLRLAQGAKVGNRSVLRGFLSRSFNALLAWRLGISFTDATCGFKFIRRELYHQLAASSAFSDDWFFVVELAVRAERRGARILDMPVAWTDQPQSKSSARLINLSLLYLAGISQLERELKATAIGSTPAAAPPQRWRGGE